MPDKQQFDARLDKDTDVGGDVVMAGEYRVFPIESSGTIVGACLFTLREFDTLQIDLTIDQYQKLLPALRRV